MDEYYVFNFYQVKPTIKYYLVKKYINGICEFNINFIMKSILFYLNKNILIFLNI